MITVKKDNNDELQLKNGFKYDEKIKLWYDAIEDNLLFQKVIDDVNKEVNNMLINEGIIQNSDGKEVYLMGSLL